MAATRILYIKFGEFSGTNRSIIQALRKSGYEVIVVSHSLRRLRLWPVFVVGMFLSAVRFYGVSCITHFHHTSFANKVHARVNQSILDHCMPVDAVISSARIFQNFYKKKYPDVRYAILTDHVNILSKRLPDFGLKLPERNRHHSWNQVERDVLSEQNKNFVFAEYVKQSMIQDYQIEPNSITVIGAGPNLDLDVKRDGISKDYRQQDILFVGLEPVRKGLPILISAFSRLSDAFPEACLHIVGVNGVNTNNTKYYGVQEEAALREHFYNASIFVLPSLREPFGIVLLEAMWSGIACIGSNLGATREIIIDGHSGYLVEPGNENDLTEKLQKLLSSPDQVQQMAEAGYEIASKKFSWDISAGKIITALFPD